MTRLPAIFCLLLLPAWAATQDPPKPHLPNPPTPNCQCGCTETGRCMCKDCDHPALEKPKAGQAPAKLTKGGPDQKPEKADPTPVPPAPTPTPPAPTPITLTADENPAQKGYVVVTANAAKGDQVGWKVHPAPVKKTVFDCCLVFSGNKDAVYEVDVTVVNFVSKRFEEASLEVRFSSSPGPGPGPAPDAFAKAVQDAYSQAPDAAAKAKLVAYYGSSASLWRDPSLKPAATLYKAISDKRDSFGVNESTLPRVRDVIGVEMNKVGIAGSPSADVPSDKREAMAKVYEAAAAALGGIK